MYPQAASHGNVLTFTPRGFSQTLNVKFPDSRLAVCEKCKKNYKTRDSCRVRSLHTTEPWTTAYICVTLDESCTDPEGNYVDKPLTVRMVQWQPYCVKNEFDPKTPVCASCKKTNRTRTFCRDRHKHRQLPWCTVYVILSAVDSTDPSTVVAAPSRPSDKSDEHPALGTKVTENVSKAPLRNEKRKEDGKVSENVTDDINRIDPSRTYLAMVSCKASSIHWLDLLDGSQPVTTSTSVSESEVKALNDAIRSPTLPVTPMIDPSQYYGGIGYPSMQVLPLHVQQQQWQQFTAWQQYNHQMIQWNGQQGGMTSSQGEIETASSPDGTNQESSKELNDGDKLKSNESSSGLSQTPGPALDVQSEAYAQWQAQMMLHQQMYHQQMIAHHQQMMAVQNITSPISTEKNPNKRKEMDDSDSKDQNKEYDKRAKSD